MHVIYGFCHRNAREAVRIYRLRYPNIMNHPDYRTSIRIHNASVRGEIPGVPIREGIPQQHIPRTTVVRHRKKQ